jgi:hypothetical protein
VIEKQDYTLDIPDGVARRLTVGWLLLGLGSLVLGGLLTVLIVLSRTPVIQDFMPWTDFFHTAIVVHVDLTVLVWFLAFGGVFWSLNTAPRAVSAAWMALGLAVLGTLVFTAAPFLGAGNPLMNNYIPVLDDRSFLFGLALVGTGFTVLLARSLLFARPIGTLDSGRGVLRAALSTALLAGVASVFALVMSYRALPDSLTGAGYYEFLFWGVGHVLQFTHTQLMLGAWLWMASAAGLVLPMPRRLVLALLVAGILPVLATPVLYALYEVYSAEHRIAFSQLMRWGGGLAALPLGLAVLVAWLRQRAGGWTAEKAALLMSVLLFGAGGLIGFLISGTNVTIPAHYHGSIVAVTLIFMGVTYHLLPRLGFERPARLACWQPLIYGGGQLLHVLGLAWSGGYGVARKTAGAAQGLDSLQAMAGMAVMGVGGLVSVVGGLLFLVIAIKAIGPVLRQRCICSLRRLVAWVGGNYFRPGSICALAKECRIPCVYRFES